MRQLLNVAGFIPFISVVFLNAFVDLGHKITIQNTLFKNFDGTAQIVLTAVVNALILLPFVMVFTPAGHIGDRFAKPQVMRASAGVALAITLGITACYYLGWFWPAFGLTFVLALQSAIYSPAKFGAIRELVGERLLAPANGVVQAVTTVAILGSTFACSAVFEALFVASSQSTPATTLGHIAPLGWLLVAATALELALTFAIPDQAPGNAQLRFDWGHYLRGHYLRRNLVAARGHRVIWLAIVGLATFWSLSQALVAVFPAYAKAQLDITNTVIVQGTIAGAGIGIILGSLLAARWSRQYIETGLIPVGGIGIAACLLLLPGLDTVGEQFANFTALGAFGGLLVVPLNALVQYHADNDSLGRVLAASNFLQHLAMLLFLGVTALAASLFLSAQGLLAALAITALVAGFYAIAHLPYSLARFLLTRVLSVRYRVSARGLANLPDEQGVLLLGNHISWLDFAMLQIAVPRRLRFVMDRNLYQRWYLRWFLDAVGAIPVDGGNSNEALDRVAACLDQGEAVCLFPEGGISHTAQMAPFKRGFERAAARASQGVIVPFYIHGLWGSRFSRAAKGLRQRRRGGLWRQVSVTLGEPLPLDSTAETVQQAVTELSAVAWQNQTWETLPKAWLRAARSARGARAIADSTGPWRSNRALLVGSLGLAAYIRRHTTGERIGILLPPGTAGLMANLASLLTGRVVVNLNYTAEPTAVRAAIAKAGIRDVLTSSQFTSRLAGRGFDAEGLLADVRRHDLEDFRAGFSRGKRLASLALAYLFPACLINRLFGGPSDPHQTAAVLFSSGSEGTPKGIELSHANILANARQTTDTINPREDAVVLGNLPLFHAFGLTVTTLLPALEGVPVATHPDATDALGCARTIARHSVTVMCSTSTFLRLFTRNPRIHPVMLSSLRYVVTGAERLNPTVRDEFEQRFLKRVHEGYGTTETAPVAAANVPDHFNSQHGSIQTGHRQGTVGRAVPGTVCRVVDPETYRSCGTNEDGLVLIAGPQVLTGYLGDPERTDEAVVELDGLRWYRTGDMGRLDADGFLTIVDRYSRFAKIGGEMISLTRVEDAIREHTGDYESELVAVNLPDPKKGERVVLLVVETEEASQLEQRISDSDLPALLRPAAIHGIPELPRLGSGKLDIKRAQAAASELESPVA